MKIRTFFRLVLLAITFVNLIALAACTALPQVSAVEGTERDTVMAAADPIADNLFQGINDGDYAVFARDFDDPMKKALGDKAFQEMHAFFSSKIGAYQSREMTKVELVDTLYVISYTARFTQEQEVAVRLSLRPLDGAYQVAGLWFDSPRLREQ